MRIRFPTEARELPLRQRSQIDSGLTSLLPSGSNSEVKAVRRVKLTTRLHLVLNLRMYGAIPLLLSNVQFSTCRVPAVKCSVSRSVPIGTVVPHVILYHVVSVADAVMRFTYKQQTCTGGKKLNMSKMFIFDSIVRV